MLTGEIARTILSFYFNIHQNQSTKISSWLSFIRRVQFALRMTIAFLATAFLAYGTGLNDHLSSQYLIPVMSILSIQETVGMTLGASYEMLKTITPLSVALFILQKIGLGYEDYIAAEILLLVSSFLISYKCVQVQTRKIGLLINAIFFATVVNSKNLQSTFIFLLLEEFVIGIAGALVVSLLIFPFFATIDIENRVQYCLYNFQEMQRWIIQGFLCSDQMHAQVHLARASTIEQMIRNAMNPMHPRLREAYYEPSRFIQRIFNRKRKEITDLKLQEQEDLLSSLMFHISSIGLMVKKCQFNEYHRHFIQELQPNLLYFDSCQTKIINSLTTFPSVNRSYFNEQLKTYQTATDSLQQAFIEARFRRVQHVAETGTNIRSDDHLSHAFFVFQLGSIQRLLVRATTIDSNQSFLQEFKRMLKKYFTPKKTRRTIKQYFKPQWPRFVSALKSTIIVGVGSVFVMVPILSKTFENGQWILIGLCMTQGDTVGGALNTMKMRLIGTLFGAMWAYVTYISVHDHVYHTIGMLVPWILLFGYLKLSPQWNYAATVAAFTPALINLGRIPYGDALPAGNYALLRIEENLVGIALAIILTIGIFPVFAIDVLKSNIQTTLQACRQSVDSMHSIYDRLFHGEHDNMLYMDTSESSESNDAGKVESEEEEIKSFADAQRSRFHQLISTQRVLLQHASLEPTLWWFKNSFSTNRYNTLVDHQIDLFRMLHNIDAILMRINECANENDQENEIKNLRMSTTGNYFLPDLHTELANLSQQLGDCLNLWLTYFAATQTRFYRIFRDCTYSRTKLLESDLQRHEQCLVELHQTIQNLHEQHQKSVDRLLEHYLDRLAEGHSPTSILPYAKSKNVDVILIGLSAMYYSTAQLVQAALALGTNIHTLFELETTRLYFPY